MDRTEDGVKSEQHNGTITPYQTYKNRSKTTRIDIKQAELTSFSILSPPKKSSNKKDFFQYIHHHFFTASHCHVVFRFFSDFPGHAEAVRLLLEAGAMVEAEDRFEMTPLGWAAFAGGDQKSLDWFKGES